MAPEELVGATDYEVLTERLGNLPLRYLVALGAVSSDRMIEAVGHLLSTKDRGVVFDTVAGAWSFADSPGEPLAVGLMNDRLEKATDPYSETDSSTPVVDLYALVAGTLQLMEGDVEAGLSNVTVSTVHPADQVRWVEWCDNLTGGSPGLVSIQSLGEFQAFAVQTPEVAVEHEFLLWACDWVEQCAREGLTPTRDLARQSSTFSAPRWQSLLDEPYRPSSVSGL